MSQDSESSSDQEEIEEVVLEKKSIVWNYFNLETENNFKYGKCKDASCSAKLQLGTTGEYNIILILLSDKKPLLIIYWTIFPFLLSIYCTIQVFKKIPTMYKNISIYSTCCIHTYVERKALVCVRVYARAGCVNVWKVTWENRYFGVAQQPKSRSVNAWFKNFLARKQYLNDYFLFY